MMTKEQKRSRAMARRAVWAMLQDREVGFNMVDDLDRRVERAIAIAERTRSNGAATDLAAMFAQKEDDARTKEIANCQACRRAKNQIGYPGMPSMYRYCEAHR